MSLVRSAQQQREYEQLRNREPESGIATGNLAGPPMPTPVAQPARKEPIIWGSRGPAIPQQIKNDIANLDDALAAQDALSAALFADEDTTARIVEATNRLIALGVPEAEARATAIEAASVIARGGSKR